MRLLWWSAAAQKVAIEKTANALPTLEGSEFGCVALPVGLQGGDFVQLEALDSLEWGAGRLSALPVGPP